MNTATIADAENHLPDLPPDLVVTSAALQRRKCAPDLHAEAAALCELSKALAVDPDLAVPYLLDISRRLCRAGTAGLSLLRYDPAGQMIMRWEVISGALARCEGTDTPRDKLLEHARERQHALAVLASYQVAQQNLLAHDLRRERRLREQAETESRRALAFKDAMIHEVNHRTKNTLQAAASLLSLHGRATSSAEVRQALMDSHGRLQLLAKVHELLYSSSDSTQTVLMPRLLETLGDALRQSLAYPSARVRLTLTSDPITLHVEEAIPIALLANEAVTNAYKHAFPDDAAGEITVQLRCTPENALVLQIADTGIGLHLSGGEGGMGLKLMRILAAQLHGALDFAGPADAAGTVITLTIPRPAQRRPLPER